MKQPSKRGKRGDVFLLLPLLAGDLRPKPREKGLPLIIVSRCWNIVMSQNQEKKTDDVYVLSLGKR